MSNLHTTPIGTNIDAFRESNSIYGVILSLTLVDYSSKQPDIYECLYRFRNTPHFN